MRGTTDIGIRGAAILLLLIAATACSTPGDGDGNGGVDGDAAPTVSITAPADSATFASGTTISFTGSANDAEDGDLTADLAWTSDLDGTIDTGGDVTATLSDGTHAVAASVTDSAGQSTSASVTITVGDGGSGGGEGGGETTGASEIGFLVVDEVDSESGSLLVSGAGGFWSFDADIPAAFFDDPWAEVVGSCDVYSLFEEPIDDFQGLPVPDDLNITFLGAGDPLDVTAGGSPYLSLDRFEETFEGQTFIAYATDGEIAGPLAADLAVTIPGDEFPAVASAAFPDVAPFVLTAPADPGAAGAVDVDTTFEWSGATDDANTIVTIDLFAPDTFTSVTCYAPDTGSFTLPDATKTELGAGFSASVDSAGRESVRVEQVGDARLLLAVARAQEFTVPIVVLSEETGDR